MREVEICAATALVLWISSGGVTGHRPANRVASCRRLVPCRHSLRPVRMPMSLSEPVRAFRNRTSAHERLSTLASPPSPRLLAAGVDPGRFSCRGIRRHTSLPYLSDTPCRSFTPSPSSAGIDSGGLSRRGICRCACHPGLSRGTPSEGGTCVR